MSVDTTTDPKGAADFNAARQAARSARRAFAKVFTPFVKAMRHAMTLYLEARAQGMSQEDAIRGLEAEVRGNWPKNVSKFPFKCETCDDTGWAEHLCWDGYRCQRELCAKNPERQHSFVVPCHCARGARNHPPAISPDDLSHVGKTKRKPAGWRQIGR